MLRIYCDSIYCIFIVTILSNKIISIFFVVENILRVILNEYDVIVVIIIHTNEIIVLYADKRIAFELKMRKEILVVKTSLLGSIYLV